MKFNQTRGKRITSFICECYCQFCDNDKCNVYKIMEKYETNYLTPAQMKESTEFELVKTSCKNHKPNEGFTMFGHKIKVHYTNGRVEEKRDWYSTEEVSEMWDDSVEYIDIIFTDV